MTTTFNRNTFLKNLIKISLLYNTETKSYILRVVEKPNLNKIAFTEQKLSAHFVTMTLQFATYLGNQTKSLKCVFLLRYLLKSAKVYRVRWHEHNGISVWHYLQTNN